MMTTPCTRADCAIGGYVGLTSRVLVGGLMLPPTRTAAGGGAAVAAAAAARPRGRHDAAGHATSDATFNTLNLA